MYSPFSKILITALTDWLLALFASVLTIWYVVTQPIIFGTQAITPVKVDTATLQYQFLSFNQYKHQTENNVRPVKLSSYISEQLQSLGKLEYQSLPEIMSNNKNIILNIGKDSEEVWVIGTHYNVEGNVNKHNSNSLVAFIELAHQLSMQSEKLTNKVILVAYPRTTMNPEISGSAGSYYHAYSLKKAGKKVKMMIALDDSKNSKNSYQDEVRPEGGSSDERKYYLTLNGRLLDFAKIKNIKKSFMSVTPLPLYSRNLPASFNDINTADHKNYWLQGFPAVLISEVQINKTAYQLDNGFDAINTTRLIQGLVQVVFDSTISIQKGALLAANKRENPLTYAD